MTDLASMRIADYGLDPIGLKIFADYCEESGVPNMAIECRFVASILQDVWQLADWQPTGSRLYGGWDRGSDWDWFAMSRPDLHDQLTKIGFRMGGSMTKQTRFVAYRLAHVNLIVANDSDLYDGYVAATAECIEMGAMDKSARIKVFGRHLFRS